MIGTMRIYMRLQNILKILSVSQQEARNADSDHQQEIQAEPHIEKGASPKVSVSANGFTQEHFVNDSACEATTQVQSRFTHNGGSILEVLDDMI
nr:hypothetical protein [Tanacetum cinerariifolium]